MMSDVREVSEWHDAMEGTLTVAAERLNDAYDALIEATGIPKLITKFLEFIARRLNGFDR